MMTEGLLWYDDSELDLAEKVEQAARRYERKFGESPSPEGFEATKAAVEELNVSCEACHEVFKPDVATDG